MSVYIIRLQEDPAIYLGSDGRPTADPEQARKWSTYSNSAASHAHNHNVEHGMMFDWNIIDVATMEVVA